MSDQNALLTESQREYLRGENTDLSDAGQRMTRKRIRERVQAGLSDLALLASVLPGSDDFDMIFGDFEDWNDFQRTLSERASGSDGPFRGASPPEGADEGRQMTRDIHHAVSFLYIVVSGYSGGLEAFESVVKTAIENAETTDTHRAEATVDIDLTHEPRPTDLLERYESGGELTEKELHTLVEAGEISLIDLLKREGSLTDSSEGKE